MGLQPNTKALRLERVVGEGWMLWISANIDFSVGTHLMLYDDGRIENTTLDPDGTEYTFTVKDKPDG